MRRAANILLIAGALGLLVYVASAMKRPPKKPDKRLAALSQTLIVLSPGAPVHVPRLLTAEGKVLGADALKGHWSVIFFGFTACPMVCPKTLSLLGAMARDPDSGIAARTTQPIFVSVDPENDTPQQMQSYLRHFKGDILGVTGNRDALDQFSREIGAGSEAVGSGIDHSTSLFVVDPKGRVVGIMLRPNDPLRLVADLKRLRAPEGDGDVSIGR